MRHTSLSEQLDDHLATREEYKLMKQVDKEARAAALEEAAKVADAIANEDTDSEGGYYLEGYNDAARRIAIAIRRLSDDNPIANPSR